MANKYYVADTPLIIVDCVSNIAGASVHGIAYRKPGGVVGEWDATIVSDRYLHFQITDELDEPGLWKFQSHIVMSGWSGYGETASVRIYPTFS